MSSIPWVVPAAWPERSPARMAARIRTDSPEGCAVALIGLPDDLGVRLNGGRPGAAGGPTAFRAALAKYGSATPDGVEWPTIFDAGDVAPAEGTDAAALGETHRRVTEATRAVVERGLFPIAVGGGHDLTYPFVRAVVVEHRRRHGDVPFGGVYFDAHLDVREEVGSGMPFRRLMEDCRVGPLNVVGVSGLVNSREHAAYYAGRGGMFDGGAVVQGRLVEAAGPLGTPATPAGFVSLDMDCLDQSYAPGVSAMNPMGLSPREVAGRLVALGASPWVRCFDIMELNPGHDEGGRTARLAAHLFLTFLGGWSRRPAGAR